VFGGQTGIVVVMGFDDDSGC